MDKPNEAALVANAGGPMLTTWDMALAAFLGGLTPNTCASYRYALRDFFVSVAPGLTPDCITKAHVTAYQAHLKTKGNSEGTIGTRLAAVSSFFRYLTEPDDAHGRSLIASNPAAWIKRPKVEPYANARKMKLADAAVILRHVAKGSDLRSLRDHALLECYIFTGRRRSEIVHLVGKDLERTEDGRILYNYTGKGKKGGKRELPPPAAQALDRYLEASGRRELGDDERLFLSMGGRWAGRPLSSGGVLSILKARAREVGIPPSRVKVHGLRHLSAELRRKAGDSPEDVQQHLDHASLATTSVYLKRIEGTADRSWQGVEALLANAGAV